MDKGRRFAVLMCAEDSDFVKKRYGGYFQVFLGLLKEEGEIWDMYRVSLGEFPEEEELEDYEGFVITGSCNDAHGNDPWICNLVSLLRKLDSMHKKLLGFCFGHQILSRAIGGKIGRAVNGWDVGVTTVNLSSSKLLSSLQIPSSLNIIECHQDEVLELPECAEVMAGSEKTGIEMFVCGDHIMGIQGHPEYSKDILWHLIDRLQRCQIPSNHIEGAKASMEAYEPDQEAWKRLCLAFLKGSPLL
ncbi:Glutamine amidotransferase [Cinnamomum micranthum f. kanehirae]|uniref:Glutamine amidotransferase n=1 Tax=Cinnamomum micranthum f. kanehirae TaxID=337451 RepID=A0A443NX92_9MAGN|nr:Glutamine amidotransferase [Cinnamomum micranthum f. kanehirae]